jgi:hypothetical protein
MSFIKNLIVLGCVFSACAKPPEHVKITQDRLKIFSKKIESEEKLETLGLGGFYTGKVVDGFYIDFQLKEKMAEKQAELVLRRAVESLLSELNKDLDLKNYLRAETITSEQVSLSIEFIGSNKKPAQDLSQIHLDQGYIYYSVFCSDKGEYSSYKKELYQK